jgi:hypothetical protein
MKFENKLNAVKFENKLNAVWGQVISAMIVKFQDDTLPSRAKSSRHT